MWSTQSHNEPILNEALRRSPMVYLVFGVNKTGQFFGYAKYAIPPEVSALADYRHRMVAPIPKQNENQEIPQLDAAGNESISCPIANLIGRIRPTRGEKDGWGTPFPIIWICVEPLSFTRIRHIRNVWNNDVNFLSLSTIYSTNSVTVAGSQNLKRWSRIVARLWTYAA